MGYDLKFEQDGSFSGTSKAWLKTRKGTDTCRSVTLDLSLFDSDIHYPNGFIPSGLALGKAASGLYGPYAGLTNETQTLNLGAASAGTFTITFNGQTTGNIAFDATPAQVQAALEALNNVNPGDVTVAGGPLPGTNISLTFQGQYAGLDVAAITVDGALTTGETITIATSQAGGAAASESGIGVFRGHLLDDVKVRAGNIAGKSVAALFWEGVVQESRLPTNHGIDAAAKVDAGPTSAITDGQAPSIRYE